MKKVEIQCVMFDIKKGRVTALVTCLTVDPLMTTLIFLSVN
jgi:hypothetical protein